MGRREDTRHEPVDAPGRRPGDVVHDRHWAKDLRATVRCSAALLVLLLGVDACTGRLSPWRAALWIVLAALLFVVLYPTRFRAGRGWLAARELLRERRVRTDRLVSVRLEGVSQRLALRDASGGRVKIDPQVLVNNPELWHRLADDAGRSAAEGSLTCGATALRRLSERIDSETAQTVFKVSGLE